MQPSPETYAAHAYREAAARTPDFAPHAELAFEQRGELGRGGMGAVYRVLDRRLGREAALKLVLEADAPTLARFRREARLSAQLDHPAIPPVYEAGTTPSGQPYLLMRVVEGDPLSRQIERLHAAGPPPVARSGALASLLRALVQVSEAMAYAHSQGVIHRDLKPANVMVGRFAEVQVMDWGLARELSEPEQVDQDLRQSVGEVISGAEGLTQAGAVMGTLGYMPPEQAEGDVVGPKADVFALGAILVTILTGAPPFEGNSPINKLRATVMGEVVTPRARRRDVPRDLDAIAARALAVDPTERTPSAEDFAADLRAWLAHEAVPSCRYGLRERALRAVARRPGSVSAAALLLVVGTLAALGWSRSRSLEASRALEAAARREAELREEQAKQALAAEQHAIERMRALREAMNRLAQAEGNPERIRATAQQAIELGRVGQEAPPPFVLRSAAEVLLRAGVNDLAKDYLRQAARIDPPGLRDLFRVYEVELEEASRREEGQSVHERGINTDEAFRAVSTADLERALAGGALGGESWLVHMWQGMDYVRRREDERAEEKLSLALEVRPKLYLAYLWRGVLRARRRALDLARQDLERAARLRPAAIQPRTLLALIYEQQNDGLGLVQVWSEVLAQYPNDAGSLFERGNAYAVLARYPLSLRDFDKGLELDPQSIYGRLLRAEVRRRAGRLEGALEDLSEVLRREPRRADAFSLQAEVYLELKNPAEAARAARAAVERDPQLPPALLVLSRALAAQGSLEEALVPCLASYDSPKATAAHKGQSALLRASLLDRLDREAEAERWLGLHLQDFANDFDARHERGRLRAELGRPADAVADYDRCLQLRPTPDVGLRQRRGVALLRAGRTEEAVEDLESVIRLRPRRMFPRRIRAEAWLWQGKVEQAAQEIEWLLRGEEDPSGFDLRLRGYLRVAQARPQEAIADFERSLAKWPSQPLARRVREAIAALRAGEPVAKLDPRDVPGSAEGRQGKPAPR